MWNERGTMVRTMVSSEIAARAKFARGRRTKVLICRRRYLRRISPMTFGGARYVSAHCASRRRRTIIPIIDLKRNQTIFQYNDKVEEWFTKLNMSIIRIITGVIEERFHQLGICLGNFDLFDDAT